MHRPELLAIRGQGFGVEQCDKAKVSPAPTASVPICIGWLDIAMCHAEGVYAGEYTR